MKNKLVLTIAILVCFLVAMITIYFFIIVRRSPSSIAVIPIGKNGIFVGADQNELLPADKVVKTMSKSSEARHYLELMDQYEKEGRRDLATEARHKAAVIADNETVGQFFRERYQRDIKKDDTANEYQEQGDLLAKQGKVQDAQADQTRALARGG